MNRIKNLILALVCWPMCAPIEENHIITALRSLNFFGLFCFLRYFSMPFVLCGTIDIAAVLRYNDRIKIKGD